MKKMAQHGGRVGGHLCWNRGQNDSRLVGMGRLMEEIAVSQNILQGGTQRNGCDIVERMAATVIGQCWAESIIANGCFGIFPRGELRRSTSCRALSRLLGRSTWHAELDEVGDWIDHPELWNWRRRPALFVSHPYGLSDKGLRGLDDFAHRHDLVYYMRAESWYFLGRTLAILVIPRAIYEAAQEARKIAQTSTP